MAEYSDQLQDCEGKPTDKITIQEEDNGQSTFVHIVIETEEGRNVSVSSDNSKNDEAASCPNTDGIGEAIIIETSSDILNRQKSKDESHLNQGINASSIGCVVSSGEHLTSMTSTPTPPPQSLGSAVLPWGARKDKMQYPAGIPIDTDIKPGEFVMRTLFAEFTFLAEKKIEQVLAEPLERPLSKSLQRGEDQSIDQLLGAFGSVAEHCLPSLLRTLFAWYDRQGLNRETGEQKRADYRGKGETVEKTERDCLNERRDLAVEFIFCLVLIEVLKQLPVHPGHEGLVSYIENLAFKHFKFREGTQTGLNAASSIHIVSDLYAEVIGVLAQSRFKSVRKKFTSELRELRCKEPSAITTQSIISLLMGMKFFRVKMVPIEEFEASMQFLQECAQYFIEVKDKDIKHALAGLFVEILLPVGAIVKNEVNVPVLKNFVEMLYSQTLDMATKKKHSLALFPLVTCLLCVSQKSFFLQNWHYFLAMCLSHLKNRDPKMSRVALESLYRLLWVYMIRIKCESNTATQSRLQSIVNSLFPKGSKAVVPRDTPLNIFVKIIQFVAQERLDFAMKEIVFDLLSVGRPIKIILTPERMSIGLRAFLVVADSLQQKEGDPPMPRTVGVLPSGNTLRVKKTFLSKMLTEDAARSIGISSYYPYVRKAFDDILRALDAQFGRTLMMTNVQNINKEPDDMITGERKPKIDLFRTCIAAIPRLIPDGMSRHDLVDLLSRLTVHWDEELRGLACQSLQNLILDFPDWREDVIYGYVQLLIKEVNDSFPHLLDNGLRMLLQLLTSWKNAVTAPMHIRKDSIEGMVSAPSHSDRTQAGIRAPESLTGVLHFVEGFALVMLCNFRPTPRRLAVFILKEAKSLLRVLITKEEDVAVIDVIDKACPAAVEKCLPLLPAAEKTVVLSAANIDLQWLAERTTPVWTSCFHDVSTEGSAKNLAHSLGGMDAWYLCLVSFLDRENLLLRCPVAVGNSWPIAFIRFSAVFSLLDPNPINDNRASILRSSATVKKPTNERDQHLILWRNYVMFVCCVIPPNCSPVVRCASPDLSLSSSPDSLASDRSESRSPNLSGVTATAFYKLAVPLIRCESADIRDAVVLGLGHINYEAIKDLMEELVIYIREAIDRKQENMRRRRRRDALRVQLAKVFELIAEQGTFGSSLSVFDRDAISLHPTFVEYIDGARLYLESEQEKDVPAVQEIKGHFCGFIRKLIKSFPLENRPTLLSRELRRNLFQLLAGWSGKIAASLADKRLLSIGKDDGHMKELEFSALQSMFTVLCCGPTFDPQLLAEDGDIYPCLDNLLGSADERVYQLAQDTIVLLLEFNPDISALLDWVVDRCYTGSNNVADGCFTALATIFSAREYPCDHYMAIINVTLMNSGCPRGSIHEMALQLLQILDKRFFGSLVPVCSDTTDNGLDACKGTEMGLPPGPLLSCTFTHSQMRLSRQLSKCHPELTMPMFSEITHRFQMARYPVRQLLLQYLLPWLDNMELVDPHIPPGNPLSPFLSKMQDFYTDSPSKQSFRKEGWGSAEATEMVLNNLFYITAKFGDEHPKEIEELWKVLCACWPNNLRVIIRYLFIVTGMAPSELLPYAKRVVVYVGRAQPERLVDDLTNELQTVENMNCVIERTETPPFFRVTSMRKTSSHSSSEVHTDAITRTDLVIEKGTIHTKRHSREDPICREGSLKGNLSSHGSVRSACSLSSSGSGKADGQLVASSPGTGSDDHGDNGSGDDNFVILRRQAEEKANTPLPRPLPMPEYGGYFSPLTEFLPDSSQPVSGFHRCNLAVMLLTDVVVDDLSIDWSMHVPLMLHIIFLGLDHTRSLVYEHCKKLLLNLLTVVAKHNDHITVARIYLNNKTRQQGLGLVPPSLQILQCNLTEPGLDIDSAVQCEQRRQQCEQKQHQFGPITVNIGSPANVSTDEGSRSASPTAPPQLSPNNQEGNGVQTEEIAKALIDFIASRKAQPMWGYEDITAKVWSIRSAQQLAIFLHHVLCVFKESLPQAHIEERWSQIALQVALSCSSRHYAGRSLQIFRALGAPITPQMLSEILSRLVETVAEQGEDMQGYVTELMLTLEAAVDGLDSDFRPLDFVKELFKSTPNLNKDNRKCTAAIPISQSYPGQPPPGHARSTSYSVTFCTRKPILGSPTVEVKCEARSRCSTDSDSRTKMTNLSRSRSAQSLKMMADQSLQDDKLAMLAQLFWIAICILESDYEYEFQLAMRLLDRVISRLPLERPDCREKVEKLQSHLKWNNFPGVHALLLKGCTSPVTYEPTLNVLAKFTPLFDLPIVDPTLAVAFPLNVMALLPYMLQNYEDPNMLCIHSAECIAQVCMEKSKKLDNLATVMTLYSRRTFSKESFQWTKCVVKYLFDAYAHFSLNMIAFLVEILEKGPSSTQQAILSIVHCMLHYLDLNTSAAQSINADLLRVIAKYVEGPYWKEALKILKLAVTRSSVLAAPPSSSQFSAHFMDTTSISSHTSFMETEIFAKKELPGRTMEFSFDLSQTPVIGRRYQMKGTQGKEDNALDSKTMTGSITDAASSYSPRHSVSLTQSMMADTGALSGWKRPWLSQARTREWLVNLLTSCGQRVGLPKSPSDTVINKVIFSQSSDVVDRQSSMYSSTEEVSVVNNDMSVDSKLEDNSTTDQQFGVFKDFDFLDNELESQEGESMDNFNWGVRRRSLSNLEENEQVSLQDSGLTGSTPNLASNKEESSDDEMTSTSPMDDAHVELGNEGINLFRSNSLRDRTHHRCSPTSGSSICSEVELGELTPSNHSPVFSILGPSFMSGAVISSRNGSASETEALWRRHVQLLMNDSYGSLAPSTYPIFSKMFKELRHKFAMLTRECCQYLAHLDTPRPTAAPFLNLLEALAALAECPQVFIDTEAFLACQLLDRHKFCVLELQEHLDTYLERREHTVECLNSIKSTLKMQAVSDAIAEFSAEEQHLDLCRCLYKLHFQLLLLYDSYCKMTCLLTTAAKHSQVVDMSWEVACMRNELLRTSEETEGDILSSDVPPDPEFNSQQEAEHALLDLLTSRKWNRSIQLLRTHRRLWPSDCNSGGDDDEVDTILGIYCKYICDRKSGVVIVTRLEHDLTEVCSQLMDVNVQLSTSVRVLERALQASKEPVELGLRKTQC